MANKPRLKLHLDGSTTVLSTSSAEIDPLFVEIERFLRSLESQGKSFSSWVREQQLDLNAAWMVAQGRVKGYRGKSRAVLVAMGITPPSRLDRRAGQRGHA